MTYEFMCAGVTPRPRQIDTPYLLYSIVLFSPDTYHGLLYDCDHVITHCMHTYCTLSLACTLQDNVFVRVVASVMYQVCATSRVLMQVLTADSDGQHSYTTEHAL